MRKEIAMRHWILVFFAVLWASAAPAAQSVDYSLDNLRGAEFRAELNSILGAIQTQNSGPTAPASPVPYMLWADTSSGYLKIRDAANANWIVGPRLGDMQAPDAAKLDGVAASGYVLTTNMTTTATAGKGVLRDGSGRAKIAAPAVGDDIARLDTVTAHTNAAAPHSGHETPSGAQGRVDTHNAVVNPHSSTSAATANLLVLRDGAGRAKVAAPAASDDIAIKATVDAHANRTDNPHGVTATQLGIHLKGYVTTGAGVTVTVPSGKKVVAIPKKLDVYVAEVGRVYLSYAFKRGTTTVELTDTTGGTALTAYFLDTPSAGTYTYTMVADGANQPFLLYVVD
jgi:hypothetical protein